MRRVIVFNHVSLDGYFTDANGSMNFAHGTGADAEWDAFVESNTGRDGVLVFGRVTYDLMASYWTTPMAADKQPTLAERMNARSKVVFSRTMRTATWENTTLINTDAVGAIRRLRQDDGDDLVILGSGTVVAQLADAQLVDEYQIVVAPVALGHGRTLFHGVRRALPLRLSSSRVFANGKALLTYEPSTSVTG